MFSNLSQWRTKYAHLPDSISSWRQICGKNPLPENFLIKSDEEVSTVYYKGYCLNVQYKFPKTANVFSENLGKTYKISREGLTRLELNKEKLCKSIAESLGSEEAVQELSRCDGYFICTRRLGRKSYSIFVLFEDMDTEFAISQFCKEIPIVYVVSKAILSKLTQRWIQEKGGYMAELQQAFYLETDKVVNTMTIAELVGFGGTLNVPDTQLVKWTERRPENPSWKHLSIMLTDPDYLCITFGSKKKNVHYGQLPVFCRKGGTIKHKNKLWDFFLRLSQPQRYDHDSDKNYLPKIRTFLKEFFEIYDSDPLPILKDGTIERKFGLEVPQYILNKLR